MDYNVGEITRVANRYRLAQEMELMRKEGMQYGFEKD